MSIEKEEIQQDPRTNKQEDVDKKEKEPQVVFKTRFTLNGIHYAEIHEIFRTPEKEFGTYQFAIYGKRDRVTFTKEVETYDDDGNKVLIKPAPQIAQQKLDRIFENDAFDFLKFPPAPIDYSTEYSLYVQIKNYIHKYTQVRDEDEALVPLWIMKAILSDILKETSFPLIHVIAPYGKGKSRLLQVMTEATPYGFYLINLSAAPLKRVSQLYSPILYVDEKGSMDNETTALINSKFNRNSVYLNADKEIQRGFSALIGYRIYGPMVMAGRTPFRDDAIESKSFQIDQNFDLTRTDIPRKIKGEILEEFEREGKEIRGKLLQFRINWYEKINTIQSSDFLKRYESHLEPRLYEIVSFFEDLIEIIPELKSDFARMLEYQIIRNVEVANGTPNGLVASTLLSLTESQEDLVAYKSGGKQYSGIPLRAIYSEIGENYAKQTGKIIQALGLSVDYPRIEIPPKDDKDDPKKVRLKVVRIPDEKKINELKSRYDPEFIKSVLDSIGQAHQTSLDNEDNEDNEKGHTPNDEDKEGLSKNHHPHNPLNPDSSQEPENPTVQDKDWQYFKVKENFTFQKYTYHKGNVSKFPVLKAAEYIEKGFLGLSCPDGQVWDPLEKQCSSNGGDPNES